MTEDENFVSYLLLLRFGPSFDNQAIKPILNYTIIAKLVKKPVKTVRGLILLGLSRLKHGIPICPSRKKKLTIVNLDYIQNENTLKEWANLSLIQRPRMFHRTFPEIKISVTHLHITYKELGIKYKFIKRGKKIIDY